MQTSWASRARKAWHNALRQGVALLPRALRHKVYRSMVDCNDNPDRKLVLKIADTREELEACFALLHDAYVDSGFMKPHPSGLRVTPYHALPTTTTLCAKYDGQVVGTISLIREGVFGFPLQTAFDLHGIRSLTGQIAEVSALAVHPDFRKTGGAIFFPLMKFMYGYCTRYFDTRHLVIAVHPKRIEFYEALLFFKRLQDNVVDRYDFANGAPAVGASLDLLAAPDTMRQAYSGKKRRRDLAAYFMDVDLANIQWPVRQYHITNDPVMTPDLLDHFFNQRTQGFAQMDRRHVALLHSIYRTPAYQACLPPLTPEEQAQAGTRRHARYSLHCPGTFAITPQGSQQRYTLDVIDVSLEGFQARTTAPLPMQTWGQADVELGPDTHSVLTATAVRDHTVDQDHFVGFKLSQPDPAWAGFIDALEQGTAHKA